MKRIVLWALATSMVAASAPSAQAFPATAPDHAGAASEITLIAGGCGPGFHRGPFLGCRPNRFFGPRPFVVVRRPVLCRIVGLIPHRVCRRW